MTNVRKGEERGHGNYGWLKTYHTFSFADYFDPHHVGFRSLRVINDDTVAGGGGFDTHSHRDMEIITYILCGALQHRDSLGHSAVIEAGEVQRITAGTGIEHSEFNPSPIDPVHFLQIWILPEKKGLEPSYEQRSLDPAKAQGRWQVIAAPGGRDGAVTIHQDAELFRATLQAGERVTYHLKPGRYAWIQVVSGEIELNGMKLKTGDGAAVSDEPLIHVTSTGDAEVLLFDLS